MKKQDIKELEKQHAAAYARIPSKAAEFEEWEREQVWAEDEEGESDIQASKQQQPAEEQR